MKKWILTVLLLLCGALLSAQTVSRRGGGMKMDGRKLSETEMMQILSDIDGEDLTDYWAVQRSRRRAGIWMMAGGTTLAAAGAVVGGGALVAFVFAAAFASAGGQEAVDNVSKELGPWMTVGGTAFILGAGTAIAGIPVTAVACHRMKGVVNRYNASQGYLSIGPTHSGIGLAWNF